MEQVRRQDEPGHPAGPVVSIDPASPKGLAIAAEAALRERAAQWRAASPAERRGIVLTELADGEWRRAADIGHRYGVTGVTIGHSLRALDAVESKIDPAAGGLRYRLRQTPRPQAQPWMPPELLEQAELPNPEPAQPAPAEVPTVCSKAFDSEALLAALRRRRGNTAEALEALEHLHRARATVADFEELVASTRANLEALEAELAAAAADEEQAASRCAATLAAIFEA